MTIKMMRKSVRTAIPANRMDVDILASGRFFAVFTCNSPGQIAQLSTRHARKDTLHRNRGQCRNGEHVVKLKVIAATLLVGALFAAQADSAPLTGHGRRSEARAIPRDRNSVCIVDVLHSEELPFAPLFYHRLRATLRITPPGGPPFETTVEKLISWQAPPLRQGQRLRLWCDPASPWPAWAG